MAVPRPLLLQEKTPETAQLIQQQRPATKGGGPKSFSAPFLLPPLITMAQQPNVVREGVQREKDHC